MENATAAPERQAILQDLGENVDRLCTLDLRPPGPTSGYIHRFYTAVREQTGAPLALAAAQCLDRVAPGSTIVIATGFCHPQRLPQGETDGPPGAAALARAVLLGLDAVPLLIGEAAIEAPLQACLLSLGLRLRRDLEEARTTPYSVAFQPFPTEEHAAREAARCLMTQVQPAVIVVTEKVGPNHLGVAHSAMGIAIPEGARALVEHLLHAADAAHVPTIGVGDNGNDIGFGLIEEIVRRYKPYGDVCQCPCGGGLATVTKTTRLVTAAVANWGAYGIVACLAALRHSPALLHSAAEELQMIDACVRAGAADGITGRPVATVDSLSAAVHASIVELLQALIAKVT
ncbi:MAG: glutamate cyclase domain-containing protein [Candidatus Tectomicrobia bacterium]